VYFVSPAEVGTVEDLESEITGQISGRVDYSKS